MTTLGGAVPSGGVALAGTKVFFSNLGALFSVEKTGGTAVTLATVPGANAFGGIAVLGTELLAAYGASFYGNIGRVPQAGGNLADFFVVPVGAPIALRVDGANLYFFSISGIQRVPTAGGAQDTFAPSQYAAPDGWSVHAGEVFLGVLDTVYRVATPGGSLDVVDRATSGSAVVALAVDANDVFYADPGGNRIVRVPR